MENFNILVSGGQQDEDLVSDGWTDIIRSLTSIAAFRSGNAIAPEDIPAEMELADFRKMNQIRARVEDLVSDAATAEALKPWYRQFCKRPTFNDDYLPTFNRPNVTLVDTGGRGVERVTETGLVVDGWNTRWTASSSPPASRWDGLYPPRRVRDPWTRWPHPDRPLERGPADAAWLYEQRLSQLLHMGTNQSTLTPNFPHLLEEQARHIAEVIGEAQLRQASTIRADGGGGKPAGSRPSATRPGRTSTSARPARPATTTAKAAPATAPACSTASTAPDRSSSSTSSANGARKGWTGWRSNNERGAPPMPTRALRTVLGGLAFGEAPRWREGRLWFSDMHAPRSGGDDAGWGARDHRHLAHGRLWPGLAAGRTHAHRLDGRHSS